MARTFRPLSFLPVLAAGLMIGCASGSGSSAPASSGSPDEITTEQLREAGRLSAYEAVRRLRPRWLRARGVDSFYNGRPVSVYLDGQRHGGIDSLRRLQTSTIDRIEWLDGMAATQRFGMDHGAGVILVTSLNAEGR